MLTTLDSFLFIVKVHGNEYFRRVDTINTQSLTLVSLQWKIYPLLMGRKDLKHGKKFFDGIEAM